MSAGRAPGFWWRPPAWQAALLGPAAAFYARVAARRLDRGPRERVDLPVLCVGNFTVGGAGKTPTALALARAARAAGRRPGFLTRGHGGSQREPHFVDPARDGADRVGDEPLLLAREAPTVVARDRAAGARLLAADDACDFILMDDGFQSARVFCDLSLLVVDGRRGLGNRRVLPAGPLRAPLAAQMNRADAALVAGEGEAGRNAARLVEDAGLPVHRARLMAVNGRALAGRRLFAFAGIADPGKFYASLREIGADPERRRDFPDHYMPSEEEVSALRSDAEQDGLTLVTTRKDAVRLESSEAGRALLSEALVLDVVLELEGGAAQTLVAHTLAAFEGRAQR